MDEARRLPWHVARDSFAAVGAPAVAERRPGVLIVEDDESIGAVMREVLEDAGFAVRAAANGRDALEAMREDHPAAIVLDLWMPVMDGWAFRREQLRRAELRHIPVLVLTATNSVGWRVEELTPAATLAKPFDIDELVAAVQRVVGGASRRWPGRGAR
jgi:DNA-binding response OmpR family regulator